MSSRSALLGQAASSTITTLGAKRVSPELAKYRSVFLWLAVVVAAMALAGYNASLRAQQRTLIQRIVDARKKIVELEFDLKRIQRGRPAR